MEGWGGESIVRVKAAENDSDITLTDCNSMGQGRIWGEGGEDQVRIGRIRTGSHTCACLHLNLIEVLVLQGGQIPFRRP
jgi:hypothetical protein